MNIKARISTVLLSVIAFSCETPEREEAYVECIGLWRLGGFSSLLKSRVGERCNILLSPTIDSPKSIHVDRDILKVESGSNHATFVIYYLGKTWVSESGKISFDEYEFTRAKGSYEIQAKSNETGETLKFKGPIDFCSYGERDDCYWVSSPEGLEHPIGLKIEGVINLSDSDTFASECRVLANREAHAVQVDFDLAVVSGINVAHWANTCGENFVPQTSFQFRMTEFDGPGTYGPTASLDVRNEDDEYELPSLRLNFPLLLWHKKCVLNYQTLTVRTSASGSHCSLELTPAGADRKVDLTLSCDGLIYGGNEPGLVRFDGSVEVKGRCNYREL